MSTRLLKVTSKEEAAAAAEEQSAIDVTTGYGFEDFLTTSGVSDPWARLCFQQTVDALVNHQRLCYPFPTQHSVEHGKYLGLAHSMFALQNAGLLLPEKTIIAELDLVKEPDVVATFNRFDAWSRMNPKNLKTWIEFHYTPLYRRRHKYQMLGDVHPAISEFWKKYKSDVNRLSRSLLLQPSKLKYAFDVVYRGRQYMGLLAKAGIVYFPHPLRAKFFSDSEHTFYHLPVSWSWGRLFAELIITQRLSSQIDELIPILATLKAKVRTNHSTPAGLMPCDDAEKKQRLITVAAECGLPPIIKDSICRGLERIATLADLALYAIPDGHYVAGHVSLILGSLALNFGVKIPGVIAARLPFIRGIIEYPGLLDQ